MGKAITHLAVRFPGAGSDFSASIRSIESFFGPEVPAFSANLELAGANLANLTTFGGDYLAIDPLVLDLGAVGITLTSYADAPVLFDIDQDIGSKEVTGWVGSEDGIVVMDVNGNGRIDDVSETLSEYFTQEVGAGGTVRTQSYTDGFAALNSLDSNGDQAFTNADAAWNPLDAALNVDVKKQVRVWIDVNHDGLTDSGELHTLDSLGVTSISLASTHQSGLVNGGNEILASGTFTQTVIDASTGSARTEVREAQAANFIANPDGHTFTISGNGTLIATQGSGSSYVSHSAVGEIIDLATIVAGGVANATGATGDDTLIGDAQTNWLAGGQGSDSFNAGAGDDVLLIDSQDLQQNIHAGAGFDIVHVVGDGGVTLNLAQAEIETAIGGRGDDILIGGGRSNVFIEGGDGDDILIGGAADDALSGNDGFDLIDGGAGDDLIRGHRGQDQLMGGAGNDYLDGGQDDDRLSGGTGNDVLIGAQGDDALDGGDGYDLAELSGSYADYRVTRLDDTTVRIVDTQSGRDGADMLTNIEAVNFADIKDVKLDEAAPMPVDDIIGVDGVGTAFTRTATARTILKNQILGNDFAQPGDVLHLTAITDVQGGSAIINGNGDVVFTSNASYTGIMSFKYQMADAENNQSGVSTIGGPSAPMKGTVWLKTADVPSDPLVTDQWYLSEANILPVWNDYTGKGVSIAQFEPGSPFTDWPQVFDYRHPDLAPNVDPSWLADPDNPVPQAFSDHATMVAGVMVAARNGEGGVGVAYGATLSGVYLPDFGALLSEVPSRLYQLKDYDVVNGSYNFPADLRFWNLTGDPDPHEQAAALGRNYLGTVMVYSAGNDRAKGGNTNDSNFTKSRWTITVGAINATGDLGSLIADVKPFSNPGASILVSAPGSNIASTSRLIQSDGGSTFGTEYSTAEGTSLATPIVSGIVALMLEANPNLRYRDVQEILAMSAKNVTDSETDWTYNTSRRWNAGGMQVSHDYGFGEVDALAAVRLAESWRPAKDYLNETSVSAQNNSGGSIPDGAGYIERTFTIAAGVTAEHVELSLNLTHDHLGDLVVELYSPTWTKSVLMNRPGKTPGSDASDTGDNLSGPLVTTLSTVHDWGEDSGGTWTVRIYDAAEGNTGSLGDMTLSVYGESASSGDDTYVFTDEYSTLFADTTRSTLSDSNDGFDTINAAAVTTASTINLASGSTSTIAGKSLVLSGMFESAFGGDGDDNLIGTADFNDLAGGRGNDTLSGGDAPDFLDGGQGNDNLAGGAGPDMFVIKADPGSTDTILDFSPTQAVEKILIVGFDNISDFTQLDIVDDGSDTVISLGQGQTVVLKGVTRAELSEQNFTFITKTAMNAPGIAPLQVYKTLLGQNSISWGDDSPQALQFPSSGPSAANYFAQGGNDGLAHSGANSVLDGGDGDDLIYADYLAPVEGADWVEGGAGSDWLESGGFADFVAGGSGNDVVYGGAGNDYLRGDAGYDTIYGDDGNDELIGGTETDYLEGGAGNDTLLLDGDIGGISTASSEYYGTRVGGAGADVFRIAAGGGGTSGVSLSEGVVAASNLIADFNVGEAGEAIDLSNYTWIRGMPDLSISSQTLGSIQVTTISASNGSDTIYVNLAGVTGELNAGNFKFADAPGLVFGGAGNDTLTGDAGGNTLDGGAGADVMTGRTGDDTYIVDSAGDTVIELPDGGFDTIKSSVSYTLGANVENLVLTGTAIDGTGNDAANRIVGNTASNVLDGKGGVDTLLGGAGNDTYVVDSQADTVVEYVGEGTDAVQSSVSYTLGNNIENLTLTGTDAINATGNDLVNTLTGNAGDNILDGAAGADTMAGGADDDTYLVDNVGDVVTENASEGIDTVYSTVNYTLGANVENLVLATGATGGTGNALDNWLSGNSAANTLSGGAGNDMLDGGAAADTLIGGTGDDTYVVDNASDVVTELAGEGTDTVVASVLVDLATLGGGQVEQVTLTGTANLDATGNGLDNILVGNAGVNVLTGATGNDTLDGGAGADALIGGSGNDTYVIDSVGDTVTENAGEGTDTVVSSIGYTLGANVENLTLVGSGAINGTGNGLDNTLTGNWNANVLDGGVGNDTLDGGGGADTLTGGAGDDIYVIDSVVDIVTEAANQGNDTVWASFTITALASSVENLTMTGTAAINGVGNSLNNVIIGNGADNQLFGDVGDDTLDGGAGADRLVGLIGNDRLDGGMGADRLEGGMDNDTYVVDNAGDVVVDLPDSGGYYGGWDTVESSVTHTLGAYVENLTLTGTATVDGIGNELDNYMVGNNANNALTGGAGYDVLDGGAGADTMAGGTGDDYYYVDNMGDVVSENAGEGGWDTVESSLSYTLGTNVERLQLAYGAGTINGTGNSTNDYLGGNEANNVLTGLGGNDELAGEEGLDTLIGGAGNDAYFLAAYDGLIDNVVENANEGTDSVYFYDAVAGTTYTLGANVENASTEWGDGLNLAGNGLDNELRGDYGNNVLNGGGGADTLMGGAGNDIYVVDSSGDVVAEIADEGTDTVVSSIDYSLGANVENLTFVPGLSFVIGTGNELDNVMQGNDRDNVLIGGAGDDTLIAGGESPNDQIGEYVGDYLNGGAGNDTYRIDLVSGSAEVRDWEGQNTIEIIGTNLTKANLRIERVAAHTDNEGSLMGWEPGVSTTVMISATNGDTGKLLIHDLIWYDGSDTGYFPVIKIGNEILTFSELRAALEPAPTTGNDQLVGFDVAETIDGGAGDDWIDGAGGPDILRGGLGNDYIKGTGTLEGGEGTDYLEGTGTLEGGAGDDQLYGGGTLNGGAGNDTLHIYDWLSPSGGSHLIGGDGDDSISAGYWTSGSILIEGNGGNDSISASNSGAKITVVYRSGDGRDSVIFNDNFHDDILRFEGLKQSQLVFASTLDTYYFQSALVIGVADDIANSQMTVKGYFHGSNTNYRPSAIEVLNESGIGYRTLTQSEIDVLALAGSALNDYLPGTAGDDSLNGYGGNDTLLGNAGNDTLYGDDGNDTIKGGVGNDTLQGGAGNDELRGEAGSDILVGGAGDDGLLGGSDADQMTGGTGDDYYWVDNAGDSVTELDSGGTDRVYVSGVTQYVLPDYVENAQFHYSTLVGNNLDNILTGMGAFAGGLGNDRYEALDNYADTFLFGRGDGQDVIRSSFTYYEDSSGEDQLDQLVLGTDISPDQVWFQHVGNSLKLSLIGTGDNITIEDWYASRDDGNNRITQIKLADNHMLLETRVEALVQAMAIFSPPAAGQTTLPQNYQDDLAPLIAVNWQ